MNDKQFDTLVKSNRDINIELPDDFTERVISRYKTATKKSRLETNANRLLVAVLVIISLFAGYFLGQQNTAEEDQRSNNLNSISTHYYNDVPEKLITINQ